MSNRLLHENWNQWDHYFKQYAILREKEFPSRSGGLRSFYISAFHNMYLRMPDGTPEEILRQAQDSYRDTGRQHWNINAIIQEDQKMEPFEEYYRELIRNNSFPALSAEFIQRAAREAYNRRQSIAYLARDLNRNRETSEAKNRTGRADRKTPASALQREQTRRGIVQQRIEEKQRESKLVLADVQKETQELLTTWIRIHERINPGEYKFKDNNSHDTLTNKLNKAYDELDIQQNAIAEWFRILKSTYMPNNQKRILDWWDNHLKTPIGQHYLKLWCMQLVGGKMKGITDWSDLLAEIIWKQPIQGPKLEALILEELKNVNASVLQQYHDNLIDALDQAINKYVAAHQGTEFQKFVSQTSTHLFVLDTLPNLQSLYQGIREYQDSRPVLGFVTDILQNIPFVPLKSSDSLPWPSMIKNSYYVLREYLWTNKTKCNLSAQWMNIWLTIVNNSFLQPYAMKMWTSSDPQERYIKRLWVRANESINQALSLMLLIHQEAKEKETQKLEDLVSTILVPERKDPNGQRWIAATVNALKELREQKESFTPTQLSSIMKFLQTQLIEPQTRIREREQVLFDVGWTYLQTLDAHTLAKVYENIKNSILDIDPTQQAGWIASLLIQGLGPMIMLAQINKASDYVPFIPSQIDANKKTVISDWLYTIMPTVMDTKLDSYQTVVTSLNIILPKEDHVFVMYTILNMLKSWNETTRAPSRALRAYMMSLNSNDPSWVALLKRPRQMDLDWPIDRKINEFSNTIQHEIEQWIQGYEKEKRYNSIIQVNRPMNSLDSMFHLAMNNFAINRIVVRDPKVWESEVIELWIAATPPNHIDEFKTHIIGYDQVDIKQSEYLNLYEQIQQLRQAAEQKRIQALAQTKGKTIQRLSDEETKLCDRVEDQCYTLLQSVKREGKEEIPVSCHGYCQRNLIKWLPQWLQNKAPVHFELVEQLSGKGLKVRVPILKRILNVYGYDEKSRKSTEFHIESHSIQDGWNIQTSTWWNKNASRLSSDSRLWSDEKLVTFLSQTLIPSLKKDINDVQLEFIYRWQDNLRALPQRFLSEVKLLNEYPADLMNNDDRSREKWPTVEKSFYVGTQTEISVIGMDKKDNVVPHKKTNLNIRIVVTPANHWEPLIECVQSYDFFIYLEGSIPPILPSYDATVCKNDLDVITQRSPDEYLTSDSVTFRIFVGGSKYEPRAAKPIIYCMSASALLDYWKSNPYDNDDENGPYIWGFCKTELQSRYSENLGRNIQYQATENEREDCIPYYKLPTHAGDFYITDQSRTLILAMINRYGGGFMFDLIPITQVIQGRKNADHVVSEAPNAWVTIYEAQISK